MEAIKHEVGRRRRSYVEPFKRDAVQLVSEEEYTFKAAATAVNVSEQSLRACHAKFIPPPEPCGEHATCSSTISLALQLLRRRIKQIRLLQNRFLLSCGKTIKPRRVGSVRSAIGPVRLVFVGRGITMHEPNND